MPFEGLLSEGSAIRIEFTSDQGRAASAFNIRFEGECFWGSLVGGGTWGKWDVTEAPYR